MVGRKHLDVDKCYPLKRKSSTKNENKTIHSECCTLFCSFSLCVIYITSHDNDYKRDFTAEEQGIAMGVQW